MNNKKSREERLTLKDSRNMAFEKFRRNIKILHGSQNLSGVEIAKKMNIKNGARYISLQYGRGNPETDELLAIAKYFKIGLDDLLFKDAKITFE